MCLEMFLEEHNDRQVEVDQRYRLDVSIQPFMKQVCQFKTYFVHKTLPEHNCRLLSALAHFCNLATTASH